MIFKLSTFYIKAQLNNTTIYDLINLYERELQEMQVTSIQKENNVLYFSNHLLNVAQGNRFSVFSHGRLDIADTGMEYIVTLKANIARIFVLPGIFAAVAALLELMALGFQYHAFLFAGAVFIILTIIRFVYASIALPIYFTNLRNRLERELQEK